MFSSRVRHSILPLLSVALLAPTATVVSAQVANSNRGWGVPRAGEGRQLFEWNGRVDREVRITLRGRDAWTQGDGRNNNARGRIALAFPLPREEGRLSVRTEDGRGDVDVIQQPDRRNDYTAIVRIRDASGGADRYSLRGFWADTRPGNGDWDDRGRGGWDRGGDRDGRLALRWSGQVDDRLEIRIQGDRVSYRTLSGKGTRDVRADVSPRGIVGDADIQIEQRQGRGQVRVVEEPTRRNGFTTVLVIYDPQAGYGYYNFDLNVRSGYARR